MTIMKKYLPGRLVNALLGAAGLFQIATASVDAASRPNLIVILTDDQGYGDLACHGNPVLKTPHLDRLHSQSIRLTDFHSAPVCTPSRGQLMTGRDAMHNGAWSWAFGHEMIHAGNKTMATVFKENGYATGHFGKWHLGDNYPYRPGDKGFDESVSLGGGSASQSPDYWQNDNMDDFYRHEDGTYHQHKGYCTDVWFDRSMDFMKRSRAKDKPFFIYLPTNAAHVPYLVEKKYSDLYRDTGIGNYYGMIANIDDNVGRLNQYLQESGLAENTIVIFMSDNGGNTGTKIHSAGMQGKKKTYYEGGHRVPCFIRWPNGDLGQARDINETTQMQDLLPTLIELCNLKTDAQTQESFDGVSLAGLIKENDALADRKLVVQWSSKDFPQYGDAAVLWNKWRLVHDKELYNVAEDSAQQNDVASQYPEIVQLLKAHYAAWWETVQPVVSIYARASIGGAENPVNLTCFEWTKKQGGGNVTVQSTLMKGKTVNGSWMLNAEQAGRYRIELRRYPREANFAMSGAYPKTKRELTVFNECKALPVSRARLTIGDFDETITVGPADTVAVFEVTLPLGGTEMKTWLLDQQGKELCGAYYAYVEKQ
ncbi:arylsulfatase [Pontiella sulfatireligans]|uniref:Arylsulfatase n=1 Tax=Pontiella sulfatireligans TaxID=2750658 RepID=A0A6C2UFZ8_9BACT|nr:arylsulfatase [Pontiella sulfatireligans]SPS74144.1 sulfatase S1_17 [Kiritimatiellales bacterium]VGO18294.1 Arylsulfatase [Pontiella sulfatireligans]